MHSPRTALLAAPALLAPPGPAALSPPPVALAGAAGMLASLHSLNTLVAVSTAMPNEVVHRTAVIILKTWHSINVEHAKGSREKLVSCNVR